MPWYLLPLIALIFCACDVPVAAPEKHPEIVIATDYLSPEDSSFFSEFAVKNDVSVVLKEMTADSMMSLFKKDPYGLGIDIVMVHHLYDMRRIRNSKMLEPFKEHIPEEASMGTTEECIKIGINPFVVISRPGSPINIYNDLSQHSFFMKLNHKEKTQFYAPYEERLHRTKTFERMQDLHKHAIPMTPWYQDSANAVLTTYATYKLHNPEDSLWNAFTEVQFPNSATSGVFYDVLSAGIVQQTAHFKMATRLLNWLMEKRNNRSFVAYRGFEPIVSDGEYRRFATAPISLMQYHTMIERMFKELP